MARRLHPAPPATTRLPVHGTPAAVAALVLLAGSLLWQPAWSGGRNDHERARHAVLSGQVLPLPSVLVRLQRDEPGQVLEVELEREDGRWIYEIKLLRANGQLVRLELDAGTAAILQRKPSDGGRGDRNSGR